MTSPITPSRAAIYAQIRRGNETEARGLLQNQLLENGLTVDKRIEKRGDLNFSTKVLATALLHFNPEAQVSHSYDRNACSSSSAEYSQIRRINEREVCESLKKTIPEHILEHKFMTWSHFNPTTKIIVAAAKYLEEYGIARSLSAREATIQMQAVIDFPPTSSAPKQPSSSARTSNLSDFPILARQTTIPDSDDEEVPYLLPRLPTDNFIDNQNSFKKRPFADTDALYDLCEYDLKPPSVKPMTAKKKRSKSPEKNNDTTRPWLQTGPQVVWEKHPVERHPLEEIQQLEQVAKRLVAKAKETIEPSEETKRRGYVIRREEIDVERKKDIEWITDLIIDATAVIESKDEKRNKMKKWATEQARWAEEYMLQ